MAMAERFLRERYGAEVQDHHVFAIVSDGDLMEGIASEAASLAGMLGLGKLVYLYDDNDISLDGPTSLSFSSEDVSKRFEAYRWHVQQVDDVNDLEALGKAIEAGIAETDRPSIIRVKTIIGWPSPHKQGTSKAHGSPLGEDEVKETKVALGWDPDKTFFVPDEVRAHFDQRERGAKAHDEWNKRFATFRDADGDRAKEWDAAWNVTPLPGLAKAMSSIDWGKDELSTRAAGQKAMAAFDEFVPTMVGGAADLSESTKTEFPGGEDDRFTHDKAGRNVFFGVREHGMGGAVNGMSGHGGIVRPYGSTFLQFADYMRGSIRLSALMGLEVAWVYTHDSVGLGEDGPTHQPVEHLAALRAIPGLTVIRPGDANETAFAWRAILEDVDGPCVLVLSRQDLPVLADASDEGVAKGAYVLRDVEDGEPDVTLVGTGSELSAAIARASARRRQLRAGAHERHVGLAVLDVAQHVGALRDALVAGVGEDRQVLAREDEHGGAVEVLEDRAPREGGLVRVARADDREARDRAQRREVLDGLVGRAVLAEADGVVRVDPGDLEAHERRQADRAAHVVGELQERRAVGPHDPAVAGHAVHRAAHAVLAHAEEHVAPGLVVGEAVVLAAGELGLGRLAEVGRAADHGRHELLEGGHRLLARGAGGELVLLPVDRRQRLGQARQRRHVPGGVPLLRPVAVGVAERREALVPLVVRPWRRARSGRSARAPRRARRTTCPGPSPAPPWSRGPRPRPAASRAPCSCPACGARASR